MAKSPSLELQKLHLAATKTECERFAAAFHKKQASTNLGNYLAWRSEHCTRIGAKVQASAMTDEKKWEMASAHAILFYKLKREAQEDCTVSSGTSDAGSTEEDSFGDEKESTKQEEEEQHNFDDHEEPCVTNVQEPTQRSLEEIENCVEVMESLPRFLRCYRNPESGDIMRDLNGRRVLHAMPAKLDPKYGADVYALAIAVYLNQLFEGEGQHGTGEESYEQITVILDVRPGAGWPNAPASQMLNLFRHVANQIHILHPNRIHKCIMFPIPRPAIVLWKVAIRPFLDHKLRQVVELVPGSGANLKAPTPHDMLSKFVSLQDSHRIERYRKAAFEFPPGFWDDIRKEKPKS